MDWPVSKHSETQRKHRLVNLPKFIRLKINNEKTGKINGGQSFRKNMNKNIIWFSRYKISCPWDSSYSGYLRYQWNCRPQTVPLPVLRYPGFLQDARKLPGCWTGLPERHIPDHWVPEPLCRKQELHVPYRFLSSGSLRSHFRGSSD